MIDYLSIGSAPALEDCAQLGVTPNYRQKNIAECRALRAQIRNDLGKEPNGASLHIKSFRHDFGVYREVVCYFDDQIPESVDYAYMVENNAPLYWSID